MDDGASDILGEIRAEDITMPNKMGVLPLFAGAVLLASQLSAQSAPLIAQSAMTKPATANSNMLEVRYGGWHRGWGGWHGGWGWGRGAFVGGALIGGALAAPYYYPGYYSYYGYGGAPYADYGYGGYPGYYGSYAGYYGSYRPYYGFRRAYYW